MVELSHSRVRTNGIELHVVQAGPVDGPVALLLHGFPECWYGWHAQIEPLVELGYRVVVPDQRGYNTSDKPRRTRAYAMDTLVDDMTGLLDALGVQRATVIGHDWGGAVGWCLSATRPERVSRFIVMNVPHLPVLTRALRTSRTQLQRSWYMALFQLPVFPEWELSRDDNARLVRAMYANTVSKPFTDADIAVYKDSWRQAGCVRAMLAWYRAGMRHPPRGIASARVTCPTLIIWGRRDTALGEELVEPSLACCDDGRAEFIDDAAHFVQHDAPDRVNALIAAFIGPATLFEHGEA